MDAGTAIGLVVTLGSLAVALVTYLHRRGKKRLEYVVLTNTSLLRRGLHRELEVSYRSQPVPDPSLSIMRVVSTGDTAVKPDDFEADLAFVFDGTPKVVSAEWMFTRPADLRPRLTLDGGRVLAAPSVINAGDLLQLQVLSSGRPREVRLEGRVAGLEIQRRASLPYPPGSGVEGEMVGFDRFMWFVVSPRTLSLRLCALEEEGIVERHTFSEVPPRVEYALTEKGRALLPIIDGMRAYGERWLADEDVVQPPEPAPLAVA